MSSSSIDVTVFTNKKEEKNTMTDAEKKVLDEEVVVESVDVEVGTMEDVDAIMKKYDRESNHPCLGGHARRRSCAMCWPPLCSLWST